MKNQTGALCSVCGKSAWTGDHKECAEIVKEWFDLMDKQYGQN